MRYFFNCFTEQDLINFVNSELKRLKSRISVTSITATKDGFVFKSNRNADIFVMFGSFSPSVLFIRSINRIQNKKKRFTYLFNGQAGKNLDPIAFFGEQGERLYAEYDQYLAYIKFQLPYHTKAEHLKRVQWEYGANPNIQDKNKHL